MNNLHVKTGDNVMIISGKDKGKTGKVISADPKNGKVIVEGVSVATKHQKAKKQGQDGGIMKIETPMYVSKVQLVCPKCNKGVRVGYKYVADKKLRVCRKCGTEI